MNLIERLGIQPGITSVIGSGGKTSLLARLADEAPGTVALATTTHMFPIDGIALVLDGNEQHTCEKRDRLRVVCVGKPSKQGKITQPDLPLEKLAELFDFVIVEADGSKQLPLKAHANWEPVVSPRSSRTVMVIGASGFDQAVRNAVHRPELFCERAACTPDDLATASRVARVVNAEIEASLIAPDCILVNTHGCQQTGALSWGDLVVAHVPIFTCQLVRANQRPLI